MLPGTQAAGLLDDAVFGKEARQGCSRATVIPGQPQLPYSGLPGPGDGVGFAQGASSTELQLWQGCAGIPWSLGAPRPSRQSLASRL